MANPIFKGKWVMFVDYRDFETFVKGLYPNLARDYSLVAEEEARNDMLHMYETDLEEPKTYMEGHPYPYEIFNELARDKFIEEGTYIVSVSW